MCKKRPGIRCSDHSAQKLMNLYRRQKQFKKDIQSLKRKLKNEKNSEQKNKEISFLITQKEGKLQRLLQVIEHEELDFDATPKGQHLLEVMISEETDEDKKQDLQDVLNIAIKRRQWQLKAAKRFKKLEEADVAGEFPESAKQAKREKALAEAEMKKQKEKIRKAKLKKKQIKNLTPSQKRKLMLKRIKRIISLARKTHALYMLIAYDMDSFMKRKGNAFALSVVQRSVGRVSTAGLNKVQQPVRLEDFIVSQDADDVLSESDIKYDLDKLQFALNNYSR